MTEPVRHLFKETASRLRARIALRGAIGATAGASAALCLNTAAHLANTYFDTPALATPDHAMGLSALAGTLIGVFVGGDLRLVLRAKLLARSIDQKAGLDLSYVTALEIEQKRDNHSLTNALLRSANEAAASLDRRKAWPLSSRPQLILLAVSSAAMIACSTVPFDLSSKPLNQDHTSLVSMEELRDAAEELTKNLRAEALVQKDPLLEAIANAIEERISQANTENSSAELLEELSSLTEQAAAVFGENRPSWLKLALDPQTGRSAGEALDGGVLAPRPQSYDMYARDPNALEAIRRTWDEMDIREANNGAPEETENPGGEITSGSNNAPPSASMAAQKLEPKDMLLAGREAVGAAAESGKGAADQAGAGSKALEGDGFTQTAEGVEDMELPEAAQETGRRIRISLPPSAEESSELGENGAAGGSAGAADNRLVQRNTLQAGNRDALARYFEKTNE